MRQLTFGLGYADYEGAYVPDGANHFQFDALRADGRLLVDRSEQPLHVRRRRAATCAAWVSTRSTRITPP